MTTSRLARGEQLVPGWLSRRIEEMWPERLTEPPGDGTVKVEEFVDEGTLVVRAELPGIDPDRDVSVTVHDGVLRIHGERREHHEGRKKDHARSEFFYGLYERTVRMPQGTSPADVKATYRDGVLEIKVPLPEGSDLTSTVRVIRLP